jgi:hypothetical protein
MRGGADGQQKTNSHLYVVLATNLWLKYYRSANGRRIVSSFVGDIGGDRKGCYIKERCVQIEQNQIGLPGKE